MKKIKITIKTLLILCLGGTLLSFTNLLSTQSYFDVVKNLHIFSTLIKELDAYYVDDINPKSLIDKSIKGILEPLDPYTSYIPEDQAESFNIQTTGQYEGIGILIGKLGTHIIITNLYETFPAYEKGLKIGDEITSVDNINIKGKTISEVSMMLKGAPNTEIILTINRLDEKKEHSFHITRKKIRIKNIAYQSIVRDNVGYIKLTNFHLDAGIELGKTVMNLKKQGAKALILDLRDNPGGLLNEAVNVVNLFINRGLEVVSTKGKVTESNQAYNALNNPVDAHIPLVILVNNHSASASEIVAGALQDYDRAVLVGQRTFGKGLVQTTKPLLYNTQLKITTAKYYIPSGRCIQSVDYTYRNLDQEKNTSQTPPKSEYLTKNGRKVYDEGGINPDVEITKKQLSPIVKKLITQSWIFEYATLFCATHPTPPSLREFSISDTEYNNFITWLIQEKQWNTLSTLQKNVQNLIETARKEKIYDTLYTQLNTIEQAVIRYSTTGLSKLKNEITPLLNREIVFHYGLTAGVVESTLDSDTELVRALEIIQDSTEYTTLLFP